MRLFRYFCCSLVVLLLIAPGQSAAQEQMDTLRIRLRAEAQPLAAVFDELRARYGLRFYAPADALAGVTVTLRADSTALPALLDRLLAGTGLGYLVYRDQAIIVGDRTILTADYGADYYRALGKARRWQPGPIRSAGRKRPGSLGK